MHAEICSGQDTSNAQGVQRGNLHTIVTHGRYATHTYNNKQGAGGPIAGALQFAFHGEKVLRSRIHLGGTELDFNGHPGAIGRFQNEIRLEVFIVVVVPDLGPHCSSIGNEVMSH